MADPGQKLSQEQKVLEWQTKLLPWMIAMPTVLIAVFIFLSTRQLDEFKTSITNYKNEAISHSLISLDDSSARNRGIINNLDYIRWYSRVQMEDKALDRRYAQTGFLLIGRTYTKYLGFFTGMILSIVAAVFIISKLKEDVTHMEGTMNEKIKFSLVTSSPGVLFGVLGTTLMMATILYNPEIEQRDAPLYMTPEITIQNGVGTFPQTGKIDQKDIQALLNAKSKDSSGHIKDTCCGLLKKQ